MKPLILAFSLLACLAPAAAQTGSGPQQERARIAAERSQVDAGFAAAEAACYGRFAVNDCLNEARLRRRERLADLRRQELTLDDAERKRRGGERLRSIEQKGSLQEQEEGAAERARSATRFREREAELARRAAERGQGAASAPGRPAREAAGQAARAERAQRAAEQAAAHRQRQQEAQERKARVAKRLQARKPDVKPLPLPP